MAQRHYKMRNEVPDLGKIPRRQEDVRLSPLLLSVIFLLIVLLPRLHELIGFLTILHLGKVSILISFALVFFKKKSKYILDAVAAGEIVYRIDFLAIINITNRYMAFW